MKIEIDTTQMAVAFGLQKKEILFDSEPYSLQKRLNTFDVVVNAFVVEAIKTSDLSDTYFKKFVNEVSIGKRDKTGKLVK